MNLTSKTVGKCILVGQGVLENQTQSYQNRPTRVDIGIGFLGI